MITEIQRHAITANHEAVIWDDSTREVCYVELVHRASGVVLHTTGGYLTDSGALSAARNIYRKVAKHNGDVRAAVAELEADAAEWRADPAAYRAKRAAEATS